MDKEGYQDDQGGKPEYQQDDGGNNAKHGLSPGLAGEFTPSVALL